MPTHVTVTIPDNDTPYDHAEDQHGYACDMRDKARESDNYADARAAAMNAASAAMTCALAASMVDDPIDRTHAWELAGDAMTAAGMAMYWTQEYSRSPDTE